MKTSRFPTKEENKAARRKIVSADGEPQTYCVWAKLSCGHVRRFSLPANKFNEGPLDHLPKETKCWECRDKLMAQNDVEEEK